MERVSVIGLGKLGLPLAAVLADSGYETFGFDLNETHVSNLRDGKFEFSEPNLERILSERRHNLRFTSAIGDCSHCDIYFLIVPTPSEDNNEFSNQYLLGAIGELLISWKGISAPKTLVIVSTVMPGTCQSLFVPKIRNWEILNGFPEGMISIVYSPEFIALGTVIDNLKNPDMVLVGCEKPEDAKMFLKVMNSVVGNLESVDVLSLSEAELVKLLVNCFVTMKISFANFIGEFSDALPEINKHKVARALGMDTRIGDKYLRPGIGFAGPCFPRDNKALIAFANRYGLIADLAIATEKVNSRQPENVCKRIHKHYPRVRKIGILGVAYKKNTLVLDESQSIKIAELLLSKGYDVLLFDPLIKSIESNNFKVAQQLEELQSCELVIFPSEFGYLLEGLSSVFSNLLEI
jgi:UDPglucose 6-dehydrogenase